MFSIPMSRKFASTRGPVVDEEDSGSDSLAPVRKCWKGCMGCIVMSKWVSMLFALLPSIYCACVLMWLGTPTGLPTNIVQVYKEFYGANVNEADVRAMTAWVPQMMLQYFGCLSGFTMLFGLVAAASIYYRWISMLSICTWTVEVVGHFFLVFFIIALLASQGAGAKIPDSVIQPWAEKLFMNVMAGILLSGASLTQPLPVLERLAFCRSQPICSHQLPLSSLLLSCRYYSNPRMEHLCWRLHPKAN